MCGSERESEWIEQSIVSEGEEEEGKKLQSIRWVVACHSRSSSKCFKHFSSKHISQPSCCHPKATEDPALPFICQRRRRRRLFMYWFTGEEKAAPANNQLSYSALALHSCQRWKDHIPAKPWKDLHVINQILQPPSHLTPTHKIYVQLIYFRKIWLVLHVWLNWLNVYISALLIWVCGRIEPPHNQIAHSRNQHLDHTR